MVSERNDFTLNFFAILIFCFERPFEKLCSFVSKHNNKCIPSFLLEWYGIHHFYPQIFCIYKSQYRPLSNFIFPNTIQGSWCILHQTFKCNISVVVYLCLRWLNDWKFYTTEAFTFRVKVGNSTQQPFAVKSLLHPQQRYAMYNQYHTNNIILAKYEKFNINPQEKVLRNWNSV